MADVWGRGWLPDFRRNLGSEELVEWTELTAQLEQVEINSLPDRVRWKLQKSGSFSLKSLYRLITFGGVVDIEAVDVWNTKLPLKIQIFIWMLMRDRLQSAAG